LRAAGVDVVDEAEEDVAEDEEAAEEEAAEEDEEVAAEEAETEDESAKEEEEWEEVGANDVDPVTGLDVLKEVEGDVLDDVKEVAGNEVCPELCDVDRSNEVDAADEP